MTPANAACYVWSVAWNNAAAKQRVDLRIVSFRAKRVREGVTQCIMKVNEINSGGVSCYKVTLFDYGRIRAAGGKPTRCWDAGKA